MIFYITQYLADFFSAASYPLANVLSNEVFYSSSEIFAYSNIYIFVFLILVNPILKKKYGINLLNIKDYLKNYKIIFITLLSVIPSFLKTLLLGGKLSGFESITQLTLRSYSMLCPFITLVLCHFFLRDQKLNKTFIIAFLTAFFGLIVFNLNVGFCFIFSNLLIIYVLINSISDFALKGISKKRSIEIMLFDNLMFLFVSSVIFLGAEINEDFVKMVFKIEKFSFAKLFNSQAFIPTLIVALVSFLAHNFKMVSYKAKHIAGIIIVGIGFKSFNSILMTYLEKSTLPSQYQVSGLLIMSLGLGVFSYKSLKKRI